MLSKILYLALFTLVFSSTAPAQNVIIHSISFEGNSNLKSTELKSQLRMSREGSPYQAQWLRFELENLENYYQEKGYLKAEIGLPEVTMRTVGGVGKTVMIRVKVTEGSLYSMGKVDIENARVLPKSTLLQMVPLNEGQPYSRSKMRRWIEMITDNYRSMGHLRFEAEMREAADDSRRVVDISLEFQEGAAYRVGRILVADQEPLSMAEFKKQLLIAEGSVFDPQMLYHTIQFLNGKRLYEKLSREDVEIRIDDDQKTVDLIFNIAPLKKRNPSSQ